MAANLPAADNSCYLCVVRCGGGQHRVLGVLLQVGETLRVSLRQCISNGISNSSTADV